MNLLNESNELILKLKLDSGDNIAQLKAARKAALIYCEEILETGPEHLHQMALELHYKICQLDKKDNQIDKKQEPKDNFQLHLEKASEIVSKWPSWKRNVLSFWTSE